MLANHEILDTLIFVTTICEPQQKSRQRKMMTNIEKDERARERESWNSFYKIYSFSVIGCWHRNANGWKR